MDFLPMATLGSCEMLTNLVTFISVTLNIYNILIAEQGIEARWSHESCQGAESLYAFFIGVICISVATLPQSIYCNHRLSDLSDNRISGCIAYSALVSTLGFFWAIIGTVWLNSSGCREYFIFYIAEHCLMMLWVCWCIGIVIFVIVCAAMLCNPQFPEGNSGQ